MFVITIYRKDIII